MTYLPLEGVDNARDVGGYQTASGLVVRPLRLLRAARLDRLTDADRDYLAAIGLRTVIDLRQDFEIGAEPDALGSLDVDWYNTPPSLAMAGDPSVTLFGLYLAWLDDSGPAFAAAVKHLARPDALPALVHCTAGKDRTGLVVAMVLDVLGVEEKTILADYLESNTALDLNGSNPLRHHPIQPELLLGSLAHVRERFGSVEGYLLAHGVTAGELDSLREGLLMRA